jgi:hypothetical protein
MHKAKKSSEKINKLYDDAQNRISSKIARYKVQTFIDKKKGRLSASPNRQKVVRKKIVKHKVV